MPLTRLALVDEALAQAGLDTGFRTRGRTWLNIALEKLSVRTNYRSNRVQNYDTPFVAGTTEYSKPTNFLRIDTVYFLDSNGNQGNPIKILEPYEFEPLVSLGAGFPSAVMIDDQSDKIRFNSAPGTVAGEEFRMSYWKKATTYSTDSTDDSVVVDFDDQWTLMEEIKAMAYEFLADEREPMKKKEAERASQTYQRNMFQSDANSTVSLNQEVFRGRPRRAR